MCSTIAGIVCKDGIVLGTEKIVISKMMVSGTDKRIYSVNKHVGSVSFVSFLTQLIFLQVTNGLVPDGRALIQRASEECSQYEDQFGIRMPGKALTERIAQQCQMKTIYSSYRPYGTSVIFATHDMMQPFALYMVEPSGACFQYYGCASGRGKQIARNEIERGNFRNMTVEEALPLFVKILLKSQDEMKEKKQELELSVMTEANGFVHKILPREQTDTLTADAKRAI